MRAQQGILRVGGRGGPAAQHWTSLLLSSNPSHCKDVSGGSSFLRHLVVLFLVLLCKVMLPIFFFIVILRPFNFFVLVDECLYFIAADTAEWWEIQSLELKGSERTLNYSSTKHSGDVSPANPFVPTRLLLHVYLPLWQFSNAGPAGSKRWACA